ncbi:dehydrogenase [Mycolicibacterium litorale]|nr:dehydrogenase [Mycolicibacterium litorale]
MKIAVTGGTGYLGAHVVRSLLDAGHQVKLLAEPGWDNPELLERLHELGSVSVTHGDIREAADVEVLLDGCDAMLHAAGVVGTDDRRSQLMWDVNAYGTERILRLARARRLDPIVLVSSYSALFPPPGSVITADSPTAAGKSAYAQTKAYADRIARVMQDDGVPVVITYPSSIVGPAFHTLAGVTEQGWATIVDRRIAPRLRGAGMMMIDVRDVADAHTALMQPGRGPKRYLCGGTMLGFDEMIASLEVGSGRRITRIPMSPKVFRALGRLSDVIGAVVPIGAAFSHEAAQLITAAIPTDDQQTLDDLGLTWRDPRDAIIATFRSVAAAPPT